LLPARQRRSVCLSQTGYGVFYLAQFALSADTFTA
jgi:hypothetical protein